MNYKDKLIQVSNRWAVLLVFTLLGFLPFYQIEAICVPLMGKLQFSRSLSKFNEYAENLSSSIYNNLLYDVVFIVLYTVFFYFAFKVFELSAKASFKKTLKLLFVVPGILDLLENLLLCNLLSNPENTMVFKLFFWVVRAKFTVIVPFVIMSITIVIFYGIALYDFWVARNKENKALSKNS